MAGQRKLITAIVEGPGDARAVPVLLRRWFRFKGLDDHFHTHDDAIFTGGCGAMTTEHNSEDDLGIECFVARAVRDDADGILVIIDADKKCIERERNHREALGPELLRRARAVAPHIPISVVVANRAYEAWFLAQLDELQRAGVAPGNPTLPKDYAIETYGGYKGEIEKMLGRKYEEAIDQAKLTEHLKFTQDVAARSPSFGKLMRELEYLTTAAGA